MKRPDSVSDWMPSEPKTKLVDSKVLEPNAHDGPEAVSATNTYKQEVGGSGKPSGPLGSRGRGF